MRSDRRRELIRILHEGQASSQKEIVEELRRAGYDVAQATVSRYLQQLGATKVRVNGSLAYKLPDEVPRIGGGDLMARSLLRTLGEFVVEIKAAASLVVLTTAPGHASAVARAIDLAVLDEVVGTVAGDDTIFVATPDARTAEELAAEWVRGVEHKPEVAI